MLRSKCILAPIEVSDGTRASIMSRHTLNDGKTEDLRLAGRWDCWIRTLAPTGKMVGAYYRGELEWKDFENLYLEHLRKAVAEEVLSLANMAMKGDVTVMCIETSPERCHRRLLVQECSRVVQGLKVEIL